MKKIIIAILAILILAAVYFLFFTDKGPVFIVEETAGFVTNRYYASDASLSESADLYARKFSHLSLQENIDPLDGYTLVSDPEIFAGMESEEDFMGWVKENEGFVLEVNILDYDPTNYLFSILKDHQEELIGKSIIVVTSI